MTRADSEEFARHHKDTEKASPDSTNRRMAEEGEEPPQVLKLSDAKTGR
jgi:hypothetical protein